MAEADVLNAIAALDAKLGTIVNTGGTASVGAILGDFANTNLNTRVADLHTDVGTAITQTTAASIAAAVWNALVASYTTAVSFGKYLGGAPAGATVAADVAAVKADSAAILTDTGTTLETRQIIIERLLRNRFDTDPATGIATLYADDGTTPLYTANVYEDIAGTMPFDGSGANRRNRLA